MLASSPRDKITLLWGMRPFGVAESANVDGLQEPASQITMICPGAPAEKGQLFAMHALEHVGVIFESCAKGMSTELIKSFPL